MRESARAEHDAEPDVRDPTAEESASLRPVRRGANLLFASAVFGQVSALLRYVVLARLLGPAQLGLAATLVVTAAFFDLISDTGSDRFLIQDRDGDTPRVQRLVHLVYVGRGVLIAAGLVVFAVPIAYFYKAPALAPGLMVLALAPFITGFGHLDPRRLQRSHDFRASAICSIMADILGLAATTLAAWLTHSYTAILYGLITRAIAKVATSHFLARRPYALGWDRQHAPRLMAFAAPLMLNGLMLFIGSQGDRVMVARQLGVAALGHYSAVLLLIYYPSAVLLNYIHALYMPMVAGERDDEAARDRTGDLLGGQVFLLSISMAIGFAIVAPPMVTILFGHRFTETALFVGLIGVLQTTRFLTVWPTTLALAMGRSRTVLASNIARLAAYPGAFVGLWLIGGLPGVVAGFAAGELISIGTALMLLNRNSGWSRFHGFDRLAAYVGAAALIVGWNLAFRSGGLAIELALAAATAALLVWVIRQEAHTIRELIAMARRTLAPLFLRAKLL